MYYFKTATAVAVAIGLSAAGAFAATINTTANVVFIVDESGSMAGEQAFLQNTVIGGLDMGLSDAGVTDRSYAVVGFGGSQAGLSQDPPRLLGGLADAATTATNLQSLQAFGGFEDGYAAIDFALTNLSFDAGAAINFILVTDEDRDVTTGTNFSAASIQQTLISSNILLNAVVDNVVDGDSTAGGVQTAIGVDSDGNSYLADGSGGFTTGANGALTNDDEGSTRADYSEVALATGGAVWDLNILRSGGSNAASFAQAFIDIKVQEIISQPPSGGGGGNPTPTPAPIPVPAGFPLLLAGLGAFGFMRMRAKA